MQLAVCEFARNVLGWEGNTHTRFSDMSIKANFACAFKFKVFQFLFNFFHSFLFFIILTDANSTEFDPETKHPVVGIVLVKQMNVSA